MDKVCILISLAVATSGTFVPVPDLFNVTSLIKNLKPFLFPNMNNGKTTYVNLCIFSADVSQYMPKCFLCPEGAYQSIYQACVENGNAPSNVSFNQATCLEQNCAAPRWELLPLLHGQETLRLSIGCQLINYPSSGEVITPMRIGRELTPKTITPFPIHLSKGLTLAAPPALQILRGPWSFPSLFDQGLTRQDGLDKRVLPSRSRPLSEKPVAVSINGTEYPVIHQKLLYAVEAK